MPLPSDHDLVVAQKREEARRALIDHYTAIAVTGSEEYGFLNVMGHEVPDPTVVEPPLGYVAQPDLMEMMRRMITNHLSNIVDQEAETFQEADDFDIDDDPVDYTTPYEMYFDPAPGEPAGPPGEQRLAPNEPKPPEGAGPEVAKPPPGSEAPPAKPLP